MDRAPTAAGRPATSDRRKAILMFGFATWAIVVPWLARALGLELDVPTRLEVVDHVAPGAVALACSVLLLRPTGALLRLVVLGLASLTGFWITVTHLTLVPEALDGTTGWGPALLHLSAGPPIAMLALWMLVTDDGR